MTLRVPESPAKTVDAIQRHLSDLAGRAEFQHRALSGARLGDLALAAPHDVYTLGLDAIARGARLTDAEPVGRRFLVMDEDRAVAAAEVADEEGSGFQANEGRFVRATAEAIRRAEADPELADGRYELRLLRIPALYLMALWLSDDDGRGDRVIPLEPAPQPLQAGESYVPEELLALLRGPARRRLEAPDDAG
jgi:hypothetical protein